MKRNITIATAILVIFSIGIIALAQYGATYSKNNPDITVNSVAGIDNVTLPNTFHATKIDEPGNDEYHNKYGDLIVYYTPTDSEILFEGNTSFNYEDVKSIAESNTKAEALGVIAEYKNISGINGVLFTSKEDNKATFYFVINDKNYLIEYDMGGEEGVSILLEAWLQASGYKQKSEDSSKTTSASTASNTATKEYTYLDEGEEAPYHPGWDKQDYIDAGYRFTDPDGVG